MQNSSIDEWPIFNSETNFQNDSFWEKSGMTKRPDQKVLITNRLSRIGRKKQSPREYQFTLLSSGVLYYSDQDNVKGFIELNLTSLIKKVELKNQDEEQQQITTIRIEKSKNCQIYIWHMESQILTNTWYKQLAQFCISQNFEGFYKINGTIDQGAFSSVFSVTPIFPEIQQMMAAKVYSKELMQKIPGKQMKVFESYKKDFIKAECQILKLAKSENIVKLFEVIQLEDVVILILEFITGGTLSNFVKSDMMNELIACEICSQIVSGLKIIHKQYLCLRRFGYVHRDLKLENILISKFNPIVVKIIDFGFSERINRAQLTNGQGTAGYIAPELFDLAPYTENCDIFSLGIIFYIILTGIFPFRSNNYEGNQYSILALLEKNKQCEVRFQQDEWKSISSSSQRMVQRMLEKDPIKRITLQELSVLLDLHIGNLKQSSDSRLTIHQIQSVGQINKVKGISFEVTEKSPQKLIQAIKQTAQEEDENYVEEISIDNNNLRHLKESQNFYNKSKWK